MSIKSVVLTLIAGIFLLQTLTLVLTSKNIYRWTTVSEMAPPYRTSEASRRVHESLLIADLHADTASSLIDFSRPQPDGHTDGERLEAGNLSLLTLALATEVTVIVDTRGGRIRGPNPLGFASMVNGWPGICSRRASSGNRLERRSYVLRAVPVSRYA